MTNPIENAAREAAEKYVEAGGYDGKRVFIYEAFLAGYTEARKQSDGASGPAETQARRITSERIDGAISRKPEGGAWPEFSESDARVAIHAEMLMLYPDIPERITAQQSIDLMIGLLRAQHSRLRSLLAVPGREAGEDRFHSLYASWIANNGSRSPSIRTALRWMFERMSLPFPPAPAKDERLIPFEDDIAERMKNPEFAAGFGKVMAEERVEKLQARVKELEEFIIQIRANFIKHDSGRWPNIMREFDRKLGEEDERVERLVEAARAVIAGNENEDDEEIGPALLRLSSALRAFGDGKAEGGR